MALGATACGEEKKGDDNEGQLNSEVAPRTQDSPPAPDKAKTTAAMAAEAEANSAQLQCDESSESSCAGECVKLASDERNCGRCGFQCTKDQECAAGTCVPVDPCASGTCECPAGRVECDGECVDSTSDESHCGSCNNQCPSESECIDSICECDDGSLDLCDDGCADLQTDPRNCGACDQRCVGDEQCLSGTCACASSRWAVITRPTRASSWCREWSPS